MGWQKFKTTHGVWRIVEIYTTYDFSNSRLPEPILSIAVYASESTGFNLRACIFQKFLGRGMPPDPPRRLMLCISECVCR